MIKKIYYEEHWISREKVYSIGDRLFKTVVFSDSSSFQIALDDPSLPAELIPRIICAREFDSFDCRVENGKLQIEQVFLLGK